jgi:hypothetical protein
VQSFSPSLQYQQTKAEQADSGTSYTPSKMPNASRSGPSTKRKAAEIDSDTDANDYTPTRGVGSSKKAKVGSGIKKTPSRSNNSVRSSADLFGLGTSHSSGSATNSGGALRPSDGSFQDIGVKAHVGKAPIDKK